MYIKDYDKWISLKNELNSDTEIHRFRVGEVRWASLGVNIGSEIDGKGDEFTRPVLILSVVGPDLVFVAPLSTKIKEHRGYIKVIIDQREVSVCLHQARSISTKRVYKRITMFTKGKRNRIINAFIEYIKGI